MASNERFLTLSTNGRENVIPVPMGPSKPTAWSPDGTYLVTETRHDHDKHVQVWEVASGRTLLSFAYDDAQGFYALSPDGKYLAVAMTGQYNQSTQSWDKLPTRVWDVGGQREIASIAPADIFSFSPD